MWSVFPTSFKLNPNAVSLAHSCSRRVRLLAILLFLTLPESVDQPTMYFSYSLATASAAASSTATPIAHYKYVYDGDGNIVRSIEISGEKEYNYEYEEGRIVRATEADIYGRGRFPAPIRERRFSAYNKCTEKLPMFQVPILRISGAEKVKTSTKVPKVYKKRVAEMLLSFVVYLFNYSASKASLPSPHTGQTQSDGTSSHFVPGATPLSGSPTAGSYSYPQGHTYFILNFPFCFISLSLGYPKFLILCVHQEAPLCKGSCQRSWLRDCFAWIFDFTIPPSLAGSCHLPLHKGGLDYSKCFYIF